MCGMESSMRVTPANSYSPLHSLWWESWDITHVWALLLVIIWNWPRIQHLDVAKFWSR